MSTFTLLKSLEKLLQTHNRLTLRGTIASYKTQHDRRQVLLQGLRELRTVLGYKIDHVAQFGGRHMQALARYWERRGLSPSSIQNRICFFRIMSHWLGKTGMIEGSAKYVINKASVRRTYVAKDARKTWTGQGVNPNDKIQEVERLDPRVAIQLELQRAFGVRVQESWLLKPHLAHRDGMLFLTYGTKGGRDRVLPVQTDEQLAVLQRAKLFAKSVQDSMIPPAMKLRQWRGYYYRICRLAGITRRNGLVSHGLRHDYLNDRFEALSGSPSAIRGGTKSAADPDKVKIAQHQVAEEAGHSRPSITSAYTGKLR